MDWPQRLLALLWIIVVLYVLLKSSSSKLKIYSLYYTDWVLALFTVFTVLIVFNIENDQFVSILWVLTISLIIGMIVVIAYNSQPKQRLLHNDSWSQALGLLLGHIIPFILLFALVGWPQVYPNIGFIIGFILLYIISVFLLTGDGPASQYYMPNTIGSYITVAIIALVSILIVNKIVSYRRKLPKA